MTTAYDALKVLVAAYDRDACAVSDSDLYDEQPVTIRATLGDIRRARRAIRQHDIDDHPPAPMSTTFGA